MARINTQAEFERVAKEAAGRYWGRGLTVRVGMASCGLAAGANALYDVAAERVKGNGNGLSLSRVGCRGSCVVEPMVDVVSPDFHLTFGNVTKAGLESIIDAAQANDFSSFEDADAVWQERDAPRTDGTLYTTRRGTHAQIPDISAIPFYAPQRKIVTRNCGLIDPFDIEESLARDGYAALVKVLTENDPEGVIETVLASGLRGRGGAGFPTGRKWALTREAAGDEKYVFVNADEGDPGAFMDRSVLESDPHAVLEGLAIGAFAIGASEGIVYVRAEYPLAVQTLRNAIVQAREYGFLGENILGTSFSFDVSIRIGAGAFVCGEETALIASAEGRVGEPRPRPPYPAQSGYKGAPTVINNVKTWSAVAPIILNGAEWFAEVGTESSKGTAVFCVTGTIKNTGLVEVPMGMTLREIIYDVGGGPERAGSEIKAVQTGGPSGGCLPKDQFDLAVDYEKLTEAGSMMGSGGMIVVDDRTCMVSLAKFFLNFTMDESCGKCTPCREGTRRMHDLLEKITSGEGTEEDIAFLEELASYVKDTSLCGLGATAPNPVLSTLKYFRDEYDAHIRERRCPAGECEALISFRVVPDKCTVCGACAKVCPVNAVVEAGKAPPTIDQDACTRCRTCFEVCPSDAILIE